MQADPNPYDEFPYKSRPIEWSAPERLALASLMHGGPKPPLDEYSVLELGCGNGANLLAMAYFRRHATFVGVDGARTQIERANACASELGLSNVAFIHADFLKADRLPLERFDFIIAHGIFSWVSIDVVHALMRISRSRLQDGGLLYLSYNSRPGWNVRGLVRQFLIGQTSQTIDLRLRAELARDISFRLHSSLELSEHPYSQLLAKEFQFVCENDPSHVAHEYLAAHNYAYWRSEFLELTTKYGFEYVADADFNYSSGRLPENLEAWLDDKGIEGGLPSDTVDLLCYRQMHCPMFAGSQVPRQLPSVCEIKQLIVASCLSRTDRSEGGIPVFEHPTGCQVEAKDKRVSTLLDTLQPLWPRGLQLGSVVPQIEEVVDDLKLLQRNGLIELRCVEPGDFGVDPEPLNRLERQHGGFATTAYHTVETTVMGSAGPGSLGMKSKLGTAVLRD